MDTTTLDFNTLTLMVTLLVAIAGSTVTIVTLMLRQFNHLDSKIGNLDTRVTGLEKAVTGLETRFTGLETRFDGLETKLDRMARDVADTRERVARVEGHLMAPGDFRVRGLDAAAPDEPSPDNPDPDRRAAS